MATQSIRGASYLAVVIEEVPPVDERNRSIHANLLQMLLTAPPIQRPDFAPPEIPWILSGEVYPSVNTTIRQIDDGEGIGNPLEDAPVQAERPPQDWGRKETRGEGVGNAGRKKPRRSGRIYP